MVAVCDERNMRCEASALPIDCITSLCRSLSRSCNVVRFRPRLGPLPLDMRAPRNRGINSSLYLSIHSSKHDTFDCFQRVRKCVFLKFLFGNHSGGKKKDHTWRVEKKLWRDLNISKRNTDYFSSVWCDQKVDWKKI